METLENKDTKSLLKMLKSARRHGSCGIYNYKDIRSVLDTREHVPTSKKEKSIIRRYMQKYKLTEKEVLIRYGAVIRQETASLNGQGGEGEIKALENKIVRYDKRIKEITDLREKVEEVISNNNGEKLHCEHNFCKSSKKQIAEIEEEKTRVRTRIEKLKK